jgi:hypothetical protein
MRRAAISVAALLVVAAGCVPAAPSDPGPIHVSVRDDVVDLTPVRLVSLRAVDESVVEARYWSGIEPCTAVGRIDVVETDTTVTVKVWIGTPESERDTVCIMIAELHAVRVQLEEPVGDRALIDGAR